MSFKEFKAVCSTKTAVTQKETKSKSTILPSTSLAHTPPLLNASSMYPFIAETYRDLQSYISGLRKDFHLIQTINRYKKGCNEVYTKALESHNLCYQLAHNIVRTMDIFKELSACLPDMEEYNYRICEIMSIFIVCELRLSADAAQQEQILIAQRIIYVMRRHLVQEEEQETSYNILRTLVYIPKLFNARDIMCAIFGEFIPLKPVPEVNVLPDKLYMLYIIVFYRWMMMQKDEDDKLLIMNFAESFMKPAVSLCSNKLYGAYLPMYTKHSTATRTILNNLKYYGDIRNACIIDNALKQIGAVVNLCEDEDDIIFVEMSSTTDFAKIFTSIQLEPLNGGMSNIKLEEKTIVGTVDLTADDGSSSPKMSINDLHDKWLHDFQKLATQYQESQLLLEKQQNTQVISNGEQGAIICLDSDSEEESEQISATEGKETSAEATNTVNNQEDLFADSYPLTTTPLTCDSDLESLNADDENDTTKISPRFLSSNLRTYQSKKSNLIKSDDRNKSGASQRNKSQEIDTSYRRDSIHISSTPPEEPQDEEDEGTDVQDENDDLFEGDEEEEEAQAYTFLPTTSKRQEKELFPKQIQPMGPYPTYNSLTNDKVVYSQSVSRYSQYHQNQQKQHYHSDNSEVKTPKKQKKRVQFNTNPVGPTAINEAQKIPLKPALQQTKYNASDHLRGFERFSCAPSIEDSVSTSSSNKQQDHLEAAALFFRQYYPGPISPSLSSVSSRSFSSQAAPSAPRKKTKTKNHTPSIIQSREMSNTGGPGTWNYGESSDDYYGVASDSDIVTNACYRNDVKLRKRCAVVVTPSKEILQYERKQNQLYNEILQKQRRKLELRALEKQREKERRRLGRREENKEQSISNDEAVRTSRRTRNYQENFMSSESEYETTFHVRTRKQKAQNSKDLEPLHIETTEVTTTTLLSQIDAHLDQPPGAKSHSLEIKNYTEEKQAINNDSNQQICDINSDKNQTKMRELNLLADIAQHLSPYQLDLPNNLCSVTRTANIIEVPKEKVIVTEQLFIQSIDNLLESKTPQVDNNYPQQHASSTYAHEPKLNVNTVINSSPCANLIQSENQDIHSEIENKNTDNQRKGQEQKLTPQSDETLEQILEESISVLTVASPCNPVNEQQVLQNDPAIPILISNVESLNQNVENNITQKNSDSKVQFHVNNSIKSDSENLVFAGRKEEDCSTKDTTEKDNVISPNTDLSSRILNNVESSIICASDMVNIPSVKSVTHSINAPPLTEADLSDISLESEISKHLPEIAEPSPVVTDISDNSNESVISKNFQHQFSNINNSTPNSTANSEMPLPDLSLAMPNIIETSTTSQQDSLQTNFNRFNSNLNTPIKLAAEVARDTSAVRSTNDINNSLKFDTTQSELESNTTPLKTGLDPEADNNVTKFLDLILNKTVTDAESETRDKIIKELNALTADAAMVAEVSENTFSNNEVAQSKSDLKNDAHENKSNNCEKQVELNKIMEKNYDKEIDLKQQNILSLNTKKLEKTSECNTCIRKETNPLGMEKSDPQTLTEQHQLRTPSANNDSTPPKPCLQEDSRELLCDIKSTELSGILPLSSVSPSTETKTLAIKQTFNIKCRVRLKRLNMSDHCTVTKIEPMPPIITNPIELQNSNDFTKYDIAREKPPSMKKAYLKTNNKHGNKELDKTTENSSNAAMAPELLPIKKPKLDSENSITSDAILSIIPQKTEHPSTAQISKASEASVNNTIAIAKPTKPKAVKTVTFDLSNLNEELRDNSSSNHRQKSKSHAALGCFLKNSRNSRKLPDNTLRAAETLQLFVNSINAHTRSPPPAEFNKKRSPIKNKCIAEDETPRPPPASSLMGTPPCKKSCTEKSRAHLTSKCKDQLVSSLTTSSIPSISSDITTARIYTSSPLDQTLPEYDDNVDTVGDSELILPTTTGSLRRKLKRPKKSLSRPEPPDDVCTDDIVNQPDCNREDDTDAVVDNEDDDFAEELLPIPAANEHILEDIVSARPTHIGTSTVIRDEYMNIEATATVPVYLFNDESRDLGSPEVIQSSDYSNVVDSSSYMNATPTTIPSNVVATPASTTSALGNLEKSMLSPSEHEVSSTQETFYQTPTKNKQTEIFGEKSSTSKEKGNSSSGLATNAVLKQMSDENNHKNKDGYKNSSTVGLLQNNQVDTTNHSPEMCTSALTATTTSTPSLTNNRKIRKASTHDEILFNELQQQLPSTKRKSNSATFCVESTSGNSNNLNKTKVIANNLDDIKSNGSLSKVDDKFKKLVKEVCKIDKNQGTNAIDMGVASVSNNSGGGSSPSTTTTINEESLPRSKRKKLKSSKSKKSKNRTERTSKISLKPSKLTPHIPANPLIITIPKSRLVRPLSSPPTPIQSQDDQQQSDIFNIPNAKLFSEKTRETEVTAIQNANQISLTKNEYTINTPVMASKLNCLEIPRDTSTELEKLKSIRTVGPNTQDTLKINSAPMPKENSGLSSKATKKREKFKITSDASISNKTYTNSNNNLIFVKDKYDLIKSKEKHHHHHNQDHQDQKDKSKEKTNSHSKSPSSNNSRLHKGSTKEKVKGEKSREKHKTSERSAAIQAQPGNVLRLTISQISNKSSSSPPATSISNTQLFSNNVKQNNSKTSKTSSPSSSNAQFPLTTIFKAKVNSSTTHLSTITTATTPPQATTATLSTNNVRKKYKIK